MRGKQIIRIIILMLILLSVAAVILTLFPQVSLAIQKFVATAGNNVTPTDGGDKIPDRISVGLIRLLL